MNCLEGFQPHLDMSWLLRSIEDWGCKFVRVLVGAYKGEHEPATETWRKGWLLMRLICEEAFHRWLLEYQDNRGVSEAICHLLLTMRNLEMMRKTGADETYCLFLRMDQQRILSLYQQVSTGTSSFEGLPSYAETQIDGVRPHACRDPEPHELQ